MSNYVHLLTDSATACPSQLKVRCTVCSRSCSKARFMYSVYSYVVRAFQNHERKKILPRKLYRLCFFPVAENREVYILYNIQRLYCFSNFNLKSWLLVWKIRPILEAEKWRIMNVYCTVPPVQLELPFTF